MGRGSLELNHYDLQLAGIDSLCVGMVRGRPASESVRGAQSCIRALIDKAHAREPVAITADHRASFLAALSSVWANQQPGYLIPNPKLLTRWNEKVSPLDATLGDPSDIPPLEVFRLRWEADQTLAAVLTSGSSGSPSVHKKTAKQLIGEAHALIELLSLNGSDTVLSTTAGHHVYGLLFGVLAPWLCDARVVVDDRNEPAAFHPTALEELAEQTETTVVVTVPAHLRSMLEADLHFAKVRRVVSSAAPLDPKDADRFEKKFGVEVIDVLGSTETGGIATRRPAKNLRWTPLPGVDVSIDRDEVLLVDSPWADRSKGLEETGERAHLFGDGTFEYLGRADGVVKVGGKRISLQEVDKIAQSVLGVDDAVSFAQPVSSLRGFEIWLAVQSTTLSARDLKLALRKTLDPVFVPRKIRVVSSLPRDERGKLKRETLGALFESNSPNSQ